MEPIQDQIDRAHPARFRAGTCMLSPEDAARILGKSASTLASWRSDGKGPRYIKFGGTIRYRPAAIEEFLMNGELKGKSPSKVPEPLFVADESDSSKTFIPDVCKQPTQSIFQEDVQAAEDQVEPNSLHINYPPEPKPQPEFVDCRLG